MISNGVYDFGKSLIESVKYIQSNKNITSELKENNPTSISHVEKALVASGITGNNQTITQIHIDSLSINGNLNLSLNKDDIDNIRSLSHFVNNSSSNDIEIKKQDLFESVELEFKTVTCPHSKGIYNGWIKEIHKDAKKITFYNNEIKNSFYFSNEPFEKTYLVSVNVYYNPSGFVGKYEIIENLGIIEKLL